MCFDDQRSTLSKTGSVMKNFMSEGSHLLLISTLQPLFLGKRVWVMSLPCCVLKLIFIFLFQSVVIIFCYCYQQYYYYYYFIILDMHSPSRTFIFQNCLYINFFLFIFTEMEFKKKVEVSKEKTTKSHQKKNVQMVNFPHFS